MSPARGGSATGKAAVRIRGRMVWGAVAGLAAIAYTAQAAYLALNQDRLIFRPSKIIRVDPSAMGLRYEEVSFESSDGTRLAGWWIPAEPESRRPAALVCHGNAGNISDRLAEAVFFRSLGFSVFLFDYRGFGGSEGKPTEEGLYADAEAAWRWIIARGVDPGRILVAGRSLGAAPAIRLAARHGPMALVVESGFTSLADAAAAAYPWMPVRLLLRYRFPGLEELKTVRCPVFVVHSHEDRRIPFAQGRRLFEAAPEPKEFLAVTGTHHDGIERSQSVYRAALAAFLERHERI